MRLFIFLSLLFLLISCQSTTFIKSDGANYVRVTSRSVVSIVKPYLTSDEDGVPTGIGSYAACEAFCVKDVDKPYLVTAAHCVEGLAPGSIFLYQEPNGIGYGSAILEWIGKTGDRAIAQVDDTQLVPFLVNSSYLPEQEDPVVSISIHYNAISRGKVIGKLSEGWYDTTQTFNFGWSGSPVINQFGTVWGIVSKCRQSYGEDTCDPNYAIISSIY